MSNTNDIVKEPITIKGANGETIFEKRGFYWAISPDPVKDNAQKTEEVPIDIVIEAKDKDLKDVYAAIRSFVGTDDTKLYQVRDALGIKDDSNDPFKEARNRSNEIYKATREQAIDQYLNIYGSVMSVLRNVKQKEDGMYTVGWPLFRNYPYYLTEVINNQFLPLQSLHEKMNLGSIGSEEQTTLTFAPNQDPDNVIVATWAMSAINPSVVGTMEYNPEGGEPNRKLTVNPGASIKNLGKGNKVENIQKLSLTQIIN